MSASHTSKHTAAQNACHGTFSWTNRPRADWDPLISVPWWLSHIVTMATCYYLLGPPASGSQWKPQKYRLEYFLLPAGDQSFPCKTRLHFLWEASSIVLCPPHHRLQFPLISWPAGDPRTPLMSGFHLHSRKETRKGQPRP